MKIVKDYLYMGTTVLEDLLIVAVHVTGNRLHTVHPVLSDEFDEVIKRFFLLAIGKPQYMPRLQIYYYRRIFMALVQQEFIYSKVFSLSLRFLEVPAVSSILLQQPLLVYFLDGVLPKPRKLGDVFVCHPQGQKVPCKGMEGDGDPVAPSLEWDTLHGSGMAFGADVTVLLKPYRRKRPAEWNMAQAYVVCVMYMHPSATSGTYPVFLPFLQLPIYEIDASVRDCL